MIKEYICQLKDKYGYSDELLNFLSKLIPCLISYYGEEYSNTIFDALMNCEIHFQNENEDPKTFLNEYFNTNREWNIPFLANAFNHKEIKLRNNELSEKRIIYITKDSNPFNFDDDWQVNILIHEILHLIKGYGKLKIEGDYIIDSTGLCKELYACDSSGVITFIKQQNIGMEEAFNCVETSQILEMMTGRKQEIRGYEKASNIAKILLENYDFSQAIKKSQLSGDDSWIEFLGEEESKILMENLEILALSNFASLKILNTLEKRKEFNKIVQQAKRILEEFLDNFFSKKI